MYIYNYIYIYRERERDDGFTSMTLYYFAYVSVKLDVFI